MSSDSDGFCLEQTGGEDAILGASHLRELFAGLFLFWLGGGARNFTVNDKLKYLYAN